MTFALVLSGFLALSAVLTVLQIGEPRSPISRGQAAFTVVLNSALIAWLIWAAT